MKRQWVLGGVVLGLGMVWQGGLASADPAIRQAEVSSLAGQVEWLPQGSATWQGASAGQSLGSGDKIRTGSDGQATLTLDEGSTIELASNSEFTIQTLSWTPGTESRQSIFGIWQGKLTATVTPLTEGSTFQFETPTTTVSVMGTTLSITINEDGSVSVSSDDGNIQLSREGEHRLKIELAGGEEALVEFDPATGVLRVTSLTGTFDVIGPDDIPITLADGDTVVYSGGAATFIPATPSVDDVPLAETLIEPASPF